MAVKLLEHNMYTMKYCILYRICRNLVQTALQKHDVNGRCHVN